MVEPGRNDPPWFHASHAGTLVLPPTAELATVERDSTGRVA